MLKYLEPPEDMPLSDTVLVLDTNGNGTIERSEAEAAEALDLTYIQERARVNFDNFDVNEDQKFTGAEFVDWLTRNVRRPDIVFEDRVRITLGGKTVEMIYSGRNHTDDMSVMYFPEERTIFVVDFIKAKNVPFSTLDDWYFPDWIDSVKKVEAIDFEIFSASHGAMGTKQDVTDHRLYMEDLIAGVREGIEAGRSVEELQATITMDAYQDWREFDRFRAENVAGMYTILKRNMSK